MQNAGLQFKKRPPISDWLHADVKQFDSAPSVLFSGSGLRESKPSVSRTCRISLRMGEFIFIILIIFNYFKIIKNNVVISCDSAPLQLCSLSQLLKSHVLLMRSGWSRAAAGSRSLLLTFVLVPELSVSLNRTFLLHSLSQLRTN